MTQVFVPECLRCGACCFGEGNRYIPVSGDDHARLGELSEELTAFDGTRCFMRMHEGHCAALKIEAGLFICTVYEQRPGVCRELARGLGACQAEFESKQERSRSAQLRVLGAAFS